MLMNSKTKIQQQPLYIYNYLINFDIVTNFVYQFFGEEEDFLERVILILTE